MITQQLVKELFDYDNGNLIRKKSIQSRSPQGSVAGCKAKYGYHVSINYKKYKLHRIIWLWHFGFIPNEIDHIDGNPCNNKIENLRPASRNENMRNIKMPITNKSGYKGVSWSKAAKKWIANITVNNKKIYLGLFDCKIKAYESYCDASKKLHGQFSRIA